MTQYALLLLVLAGCGETRTPTAYCLGSQDRKFVSKCYATAAECTLTRTQSAEGLSHGNHEVMAKLLAGDELYECYPIYK